MGKKREHYKVKAARTAAAGMVSGTFKRKTVIDTSKAWRNRKVNDAKMMLKD